MPLNNMEQVKELKQELYSEESVLLKSFRDFVATEVNYINKTNMYIYMKLCLSPIKLPVLY
jgi:hypothetical protein